MKRWMSFIILMFSIWGCQQNTSPEKELSKEKQKAQANERVHGIVFFTSISMEADLYYKGNPAYIVQWEDKNGVNLAILSQTGTFPSLSAQEALNEGEAKEVVNGSDAELYAYHYVKRGTNWEKWFNETWVEWQCPRPLKTGFAEAPQITDLDRDGLGEWSFKLFEQCGSKNHKILLIEEDKAVYKLATGDGMKTVEGRFRNFDDLKTFSLKQWESF